MNQDNVTMEFQKDDDETINVYFSWSGEDFFLFKKALQQFSEYVAARAVEER